MLVDEVVVLSVEDAGYYSGPYTSGNTVKVTLQKDDVIVSCDGILIWEDEMAAAAFDEWLMLAECGEEGYEVVR